MTNRTRVAIVVALIGMVAAVVAVKNLPHEPDVEPMPPVASTPEALPRLVDLGADKCIPCKEMAPILEALKEDFAGVFDVEFIDVWKFPDAADPYEIRLIPTQVFLDASGKELFRHEGFLGRDEILATWTDHGVEVHPTP